MSSLSQRLQREREKAARLEHKATLRQQKARIERISTREQIALLRADVAR
jgi:hypothetical protein